MDWNKFEEDIKNSRFDFTENQLKTLKTSCTELYRLLKFVFDSPRKLTRPYNSMEQYRFQRERVYQSPSDYYQFRNNETEIKIWKRKNGYSVAVCGDFVPTSVNFSAFVGNEKTFSQGYRFYGVWPRQQFENCVYTFQFVVREYILSLHNNMALF